MSITSNREFIRALRKRPGNFYVVHYACQSLFDNRDHLSPRITSIVISHFSSEQTVSFSTHAIAEELHIPKENVRQQFDEVELRLLEDFYAFVRDRRAEYWVHWNMRNLTYGFEHLEHRYRALGKMDAAVIPIERRINLNDMLARHYGSKYAPHPKMKSLMELNGGIHRHFLSGEEEVNAFNESEFIRIHNSNLCKVGFFSNVMRRMVSGRLNTKSKELGAILDKLFEGRLAKFIGLLGSLVSIFMIIDKFLLNA